MKSNFVLKRSTWEFCSRVLDVKEYPQVFLVDYDGKAERLIFKQTYNSLIELIDQIDHGKGKKTYNLYHDPGSLNSLIQNIKLLKSRLNHLVFGDFLFGVVLIILNILFLSFSWKLSGWLVSMAWNHIEGEDMASSGGSWMKKSK